MEKSDYIGAGKLAGLTGRTRENITRLGRRGDIPGWIAPKKERSPCRFRVDAELEAWIAGEQSKIALTPGVSIRNAERACLKSLAEALHKLLKNRRWMYWSEPKLRAYLQILSPLGVLEGQISEQLAARYEQRNFRPISSRGQELAADYRRQIEANREAVTASSGALRPSRSGGGSGRR